MLQSAVGSGAHPIRRFGLAASCGGGELLTVFRQIGDACREFHTTHALLTVSGEWTISRPQFGRAVRELCQSGCGVGFRLACVAKGSGTFEDIAFTEDTGVRDGILVRVFFNERNALAWLMGSPLVTPHRQAPFHGVN